MTLAISILFRVDMKISSIISSNESIKNQDYNIYERQRDLPICSKCNPYVCKHDDVIIWKHFPRYWPFVWGIHWSPVNSPHKGQWRGALMFLRSAPWINGWVNNRGAGDLRRHRAHYDVTLIMFNDFHLRYSKPNPNHWEIQNSFVLFL